MGFTPTRQIERLPDPLGDRHMTRACDALNFSVLWILHNYLKSLSHGMSLSDSFDESNSFQRSSGHCARLGDSARRAGGYGAHYVDRTHRMRRHVGVGARPHEL